MHKMIINRIEELWPLYGKVRLDPTSSRWKNLTINGIHISKIDLTQLDDKTLLNVFELFIRQCQTQM